MEVTVNKDAKTTGIVTIFSLKTGAVNGFYLTAEYRCAFLDQLRSLVQAKWPQFHQDEMQSPRMPKDEKQVLAVEALIESWDNPFVGNQDLNTSRQRKKLLQIFHTTYFTPVRFENKNYSNLWKKSFKAPLPRKSVTILWSWKNWRCLRHSVRRKQSRLREEPWYSRPTDLFSGEI